MTEQSPIPSVHDRMAYRITARLFDTAFAALERPSPEDQRLLLAELDKRGLHLIRQRAPNMARPIHIIGVELRSQNSADVDVIE